MNPDFKKKLFQLLDATPEVEDNLVEQDESLREVRDTLHAAIRNVVPRDPWAYWVSRGLDAMEQERADELVQSGVHDSPLPGVQLAAPVAALAERSVSDVDSDAERTPFLLTLDAVKAAFAKFNPDSHGTEATIERLVDLCQRCKTAYRRHYVPQIDFSPLGDDGTSGQVLKDKDALEIKVPADEWPFGLGLLLVFASNAQNTAVEKVALLARNIGGFRYIKRPWSKFTGIKRSVTNQVVAIPATENTIGMFQKAEVQKLHDNCDDPELKQQIADFLKLFPDDNLAT
jgi:hypothetical protein